MEQIRNHSEKLLHAQGALEEKDFMAAMCNLIAVLKDQPGYFWVGLYRVVDEELILGPFQGLPACTRIRFGKGVCGTAWKEKRSILVPDVDTFDGHIACNSLSRSEVVVPVFDSEGRVVFILDVDSDRLNEFTQADVDFLEEVASLISKKLPAEW